VIAQEPAEIIVTRPVDAFTEQVGLNVVYEIVPEVAVAETVRVCPVSPYVRPVGAAAKVIELDAWVTENVFEAAVAAA
jgi:hypothetical protein